MARSVGWLRECSDTVRRRIEEALQVKLYIVHQVGPTGFILKEDGRTKKQNVDYPSYARSFACLPNIAGVPG